MLSRSMCAGLLTAVSAGPALADFLPSQSSVEPGFVVPARGKIGETDADIRAPRVALDLGAKWMLSPRWLFGLGAGVEHSHYRVSNFGKLLPGADEPLRDAFQVKLSPTFTYLYDERWAFVAGVNFGAAGDPDEEISRSLTVGGLLGARRQFSQNFATEVVHQFRPHAVDSGLLIGEIREDGVEFHERLLIHFRLRIEAHEGESTDRIVSFDFLTEQLVQSFCRHGPQ